MPLPLLGFDPLFLLRDMSHGTKLHNNFPPGINKVESYLMCKHVPTAAEAIRSGGGDWTKLVQCYVVCVCVCLYTNQATLLADLQGCLGRWFVSSDIHMNVMMLGFLVKVIKFSCQWF